MALPAIYKTAIDLVDSSVLLASVEDEPGYGEFEFSYSCSVNTYTIRGGSFIACAHGAVHLLEAMGYIFLAPTQEFWVKPAGPSLPKNLTQTKTQFWMPSCSYGQQYTNSWEYGLISWRTQIEADTAQWYQLVGWAYQAYPNGHRQSSVIDYFSSYFASNPGILTNPGNTSTGRSFRLDIMTAQQKDYVAQLGASYLLNSPDTAAKLALYGRCEYDAADGDPNSSDLYFAHAIAVCQYVRSGVPSLEGKPAKAGIPDAELGVYAYAGHKAKPSFDVRPYIYVGVALGFSPASSWLPRMIAHRDNSTNISVREYMDPHQYTMGMPMNGRRLTRTYPDVYDDYYEAGLRGVQMGDGNGNWLMNLVGNRHFNMKLRTGTYTYEQARDDVVNGLLGGDTAAADLYDYIMDPYRNFQRFSLYGLMLKVDALEDGWFKTYWEQLMVLAYEYEMLPTKPTQAVIGNAYDLALTAHLKHAVGVGLSQIFHSYGHIRRLAGAGNVNGQYPHLYFKNSQAVWYSGYTTPTHADYLAAKAALAPLVARADDLDSTTLVMIKGVKPSWWTSNNVSAQINTLGTATLAFVGPGNYTQSGSISYDDPDTGALVTEPYDAPPVLLDSDIHYLQSSADLQHVVDAGKLFVSAFPRTRIDPNPGGQDFWGYNPGRCVGEFKAENSSRYRFEDAAGQFDVLPGTAQDDARMNNLGQGQFRVVGDQIAGSGMITNGNIWLSMDPNYALIPMVIAAEDFPALSVATPG